jgi:transposase
VCPARAVGAAWVVPKANAWAMNLHLSEISRQVAPGAHAVVVLDGAGWHQTGGQLCIPEDLSVLHLPPYAPELNPVENVWHYLRQNELSFRVWADYKAIVATCCEAWSKLMSRPERLASITQRDWANLAGPASPVNI